MLQKTGLLNQRVFGAHCYLEDPEKDLAVMTNPNFSFIHCRPQQAPVSAHRPKFTLKRWRRASIPRSALILIPTTMSRT